MLSVSTIIHDASPYDIAFFHDFILFLERLKEQPIKRTITGMISLSDISDLLIQFKSQERIEEHKRFGWSLRREEELDFLTQIKFIAEVMFLTYRRKGFLLLSKNGKGFLENLDTYNQYKEMVLHYWYKINWGYFTPGQTIGGNNLAKFLQHYQNFIWQELLNYKREWVDYKEFCLLLMKSLRLESYAEDYDQDLTFHINLILFERNLKRFGCVEVVNKPSKYEWRRKIEKFRSTVFGLSAYNKALFNNYL